MRRLAAELFREVGVRPLENTREAAMVERFYCSRLYMDYAQSMGAGIIFSVRQSCSSWVKVV